MTPASIRPGPSDVSTPELQKLIFVQNLPLDPDSRDVLQKHLEEARAANDKGAIAFIAFSLAYSLDHSGPYDHKRAITLLTEALSYFPKWPEALFNRGTAQIHVKDFHAAVKDLDSAEEAYFGTEPPNLLRPEESDLVLAKLLMFRAEALTGRNGPGDSLVARSELLRAEMHLLRCVDQKDHNKIEKQARFWLRQVPTRLRSTLTLESISQKEADLIRNPWAYLLGLLVAPFVIWWLVAISTPPNPTEATPANTNQMQPDNKKQK